MSIQNYLNKIKDAVFGKDIREAIYASIKQCYDDAAVNHDNANMEVKFARGSHHTLNDRLTEHEKNQKEINEQLDNRAKYNNKKLNNLESIINKTKLDIFAGIDSLTANSNSYLKYLERNLIGQLGDRGAGLCMLDYQCSVENGHDFSVNGFSSIKTDLLWNDAPRKFSICGLGVYGNNLVNGTLDYNCKRKFTNARLIYLKQPNGGNFKFGKTGDTLDNYSYVDTNSSTFELGYIDLKGRDSFTNSYVSVANATGKVALFGIFFTNGENGVTVSRLAIGGSKLVEHNRVDSVFKQKWINLLKPDLYLCNLGANDANEITQDEYKNEVIKFTDNIKNGNSDTQIILICPNDTSNSNNNTQKYYEGILKQIAKEKKYGFISNRDILGDYNKAQKDGMMEDPVHPSSIGGLNIANNLLEYMGYNVNVPFYGYETFFNTENEDNDLKNEFILSSRFGTIEEQTYTIGLAAGYSVAILEFDVIAGINSTAMSTVNKFYVSINNGTGENTVTETHVIKSDKIVNESWSSFTNNGVDIQSSILENKCKISFTDTSLNNLGSRAYNKGLIKCKAYRIYGSSKKFIFEN